MNNSPDLLSEDSLPFAELIELSADIEGLTGSVEEGVQMSIEAVTMNMPIQLEILRNADGQLQIGGIPPIHYVETTFFPVFHQLELTLAPIHHEEV